MTRTTLPDPYAAVVRTLSEAVLVCDADGRVVEVNPAATTMTGYAAQELVGLLPFAVEDPALAAERWAAVLVALAARDECVRELPMRRADGEVRVARATWTMLRDGQEVVGYVGVIRDLTDGLVGSALLAEAELRWRLTMDAAPIGLALIGLDGRLLRVNRALADVVGCAEPELLARTLQSLGHPDDLALLDLRTLADQGTAQARLRHADGTDVWVRLSVGLVQREDGHPLHYVAHVEDVTAARRTHDRLSAVIASASDAFISMDRTGLVTEWNDAATEMFGWAREEALQRPLSWLVMGAGMRAAHEAGLSRLNSGGPPVVLGQRLELTAVRRSGEEFPIELTVWRTSETGSGAGEFHAFLRDISDKVHAAARAAELVARQQSIVEAQLDLAQVELTPSKVMQQICEQAARITGATAAVIELRDDAEMVTRSGTASMRDFLGLRLPVDGSLSGLCMTTGVTQQSDDTLDDLRVHAKSAARSGARSVVVTPLRQGSALVGVLKVMSPEPGRFDADDASALELLAVPFGTAMTNAWRLEATSQQAISDPLTGLANRAYALHELERSLARQQRHGGHTAVIFVDLDRFKAVNDTWGHAAGDELLSAVAERLRAAVRATDLPARYGGDEFVIVCEHLVMPDDALVLAERLVASIPGDYALEPGVASIGASVGIAVAVGPVPAAALLRVADEAMYFAKQDGGSRYCIRTIS